MKNGSDPASALEGSTAVRAFRFDRFQIVLLTCFAILALVTFSVGHTDARTDEITSGIILVVGMLLALLYTMQAAYLTRGRRAAYLIWRSVSFACVVAVAAASTDVIVRLQTTGPAPSSSNVAVPFWGLVYVGFGLLAGVFIYRREELGLRLRGWMVGAMAGMLAVALPLYTAFVTLPYLRKGSLTDSVKVAGAVFMTLDIIALAAVLLIVLGLKPGREAWPWRLIFGSVGVLALTSLVTENLRGRTDASSWGASGILYAVALVLLCLSAIAQTSESWKEGEQSRLRSRWLAALNRLGLTVNRLMDRKTVADTAVAFFSTFAGVKNVAFHSIDYADGCLSLEASRGIDPKMLPTIERIDMTEKMHNLLQTYARDSRTLDFYADPIFVTSLEGSVKIMPDIEISPWDMVKDLRTIIGFFAVLGSRGYVRIPIQTPDTLLGFVFLSGITQAEFNDDVKEVMGSAGRIISLAMNNALLYEDLANRHAELKDAYGELEQADRYKDDIISITSHELRSPLTLLSGYSDILLSADERISSDTREHALEAIMKATLRMKKIAEDFTDVVAIRSGSLVVDIGAFPPEELVRDIYERLPENERRRVQVDARKASHTLYIDFDKTARAIGNLVENALKFDENEGLVEVSLSNGRGDLRVAVRDHGPGIPSAEREAVFERFYQTGDSLHHHYEGMGMGLFIARNVVEAQGGRLGLKPTPGGGSTFTIVLPQTNYEGG